MAAARRSRPPADVHEFLARVQPAVRAEDGRVLAELMERVTGESPVMWGPTMVGFGSRHYRYDSGREGDTFAVGFSPRKASVSLYRLSKAAGADVLLSELGKHRAGAGCLYVMRRRRPARSSREKLAEGLCDRVALAVDAPPG